MKLLLAPVGIAVLLLSLAPAAEASWPAQGLLVEGGSRAQFNPLIARDGAGGVFIYWASPVDDTSGELRLQRITSDGNVALGWPPNGVALRRIPMQGWPPLYSFNSGISIVSDGSGGLYALLGTAIWRVNGLGAVAPGWPAAGLQFTTDAFSSGGRLAADGVGGVFVAWSDMQDGDLHARVQHLNGSGDRYPGWPAVGLRCSTPYWGQRDPDVVPDGAGGAWLGWVEDGWLPAPARLSSISYQRIVHHVLSNGTVDPALPAGGIKVGGHEAWAALQIVSDEAGGVVASWFGSDVGETHYGCFLLRIASGGSPAPGWPAPGLLVSETAAYGVASSDAQGGILLGCINYDLGTNSTEARVMRFGADGAGAAGWNSLGVLLGPVDPLSFGSPQPVADGTGGAVVVWADSSADRSVVHLFAQHVNADGTMPWIRGSSRLPVCTANGARGAVVVVGDGAGGAFVAWVDQRSDDGDVYLARVSLDDLTSDVPPVRPAFPNTLRLGLASPNPSSDEVQMSLHVPATERVTAEIFDAAGRRCRTLVSGESWAAGTHSLRWDGRDNASRAAAPGLYLLRVRAGGESVSIRLVRMP